MSRITITSIDLNHASADLDAFRQGSVRSRLAKLEVRFAGKTHAAISNALVSEELTGALFASALFVKDASSQINEIVHALGILRCLPLILEGGERVESLSLGAGNTGRQFDLETNLRVAEFKFTEWKGADAVRQDSLFKDFYELAEHTTEKRKYLYLIGMDYAMRFLKGGRACKSVMQRHKKTWEHFSINYSAPVLTVADYYRVRGSHVTIVDLTSLLPEMATR